MLQWTVTATATQSQRLDSERSGNHTTHNVNGERRENKVLPKPHGPTSRSRYTFLTGNMDHTVKCDPTWHMLLRVIKNSNLTPALKPTLHCNNKCFHSACKWHWMFITTIMSIAIHHAPCSCWCTKDSNGQVTACVECCCVRHHQHSEVWPWPGSDTARRTSLARRPSWQW